MAPEKRNAPAMAKTIPTTPLQSPSPKKVNRTTPGKATPKSPPPLPPQSPPPKKVTSTTPDIAKTTPTPKRVTRSSTRGAAPEEPPAKKAKVTTPKLKPQAPATEKSKKTPLPKTQSGTPVKPKKDLKIIIEASKICRSFANRALEVQEGLISGVPGIVIEINPEEPRKGCFEIRNENGETFVSLLNMPRPFKMMRALDMKKVVTDIIEKVG